VNRTKQRVQQTSEQRLQMKPPKESASLDYSWKRASLIEP
jgi:hypothetical protein